MSDYKELTEMYRERAEKAERERDEARKLLAEVEARLSHALEAHANELTDLRWKLATCTAALELLDREVAADTIEHRDVIREALAAAKKQP